MLPERPFKVNLPRLPERPFGRYRCGMPRRPQTAGKPDDLVYLHLRVPNWLKKRAVDKAKTRATDLTGYVTGLLVADLGDKQGK